MNLYNNVFESKTLYFSESHTYVGIEQISEFIYEMTRRPESVESHLFICFLFSSTDQVFEIIRVNSLLDELFNSDFSSTIRQWSSVFFAHSDEC